VWPRFTATEKLCLLAADQQDLCSSEEGRKRKHHKKEEKKNIWAEKVELSRLFSQELDLTLLKPASLRLAFHYKQA